MNTGLLWFLSGWKMGTSMSSLRGISMWTVLSLCVVAWSCRSLTNVPLSWLVLQMAWNTCMTSSWSMEIWKGYKNFPNETSPYLHPKHLQRQTSWLTRSGRPALLTLASQQSLVLQLTPLLGPQGCHWFQMTHLCHLLVGGLAGGWALNSWTQKGWEYLDQRTTGQPGSLIAMHLGWSSMK